MAVEIRQLTIHCEVESPEAGAGERSAHSDALRQAAKTWKREVLAECDRRIAQALRRTRER